MRNVISLNKNWAFIQENAGLPGEMPTDWHKVDLPHTWNAVDGHDGNGSYDRGTYWYAKTFETPKQPLGGGKVYVEILAAGQQATVYVNGKEVTYHEGGYSTFRADITDVCHEKGDNLLVIACSNEMKDSVYPQSADFTFYGGLYRGVNLISVPDAHFDLEYYGGPGIQVTPKPCECGGAAFEIVSYVKETDENFTVLYAICDAEGNEVASACRPADETTVTVYVPDAKLWEIDAPYLYTVTAKLQRRNETYDEISARVGVRSFSCDPNKGFIINGAETPLRGVSRHQDMLYKGNALTKEDHYEDARLIKELGANTIRLAHYQHSQDFYDACDELGLVVWQDLMFACALYPSNDEFLESIREEVKDNVIRLRNHACLVLWCGNNENEWFHDYEHHAEGLTHELRMKNLQQYEVHLAEIVRKYDPDRLYWPSSPSSGGGYYDPNGYEKGDVHCWYVWYLPAKPYTFYRDCTGRFISEFGLESFQNYKTLCSYLEPEDMSPNSEVMDYMQHCSDNYCNMGNGKIMNYIFQEVRAPKNFKEYIFASQYAQAEGIKYGTYHFRSMKPRCMGALYWQIVDCFPGTSWSGIDYEYRLKVLHYYARRFFSQVVLCVKEDRFEPRRLEIFVVNDHPEGFTANLIWALRDSAGCVVKEGKKEIQIQGSSSSVFQEMDWTEEIREEDKKQYYLELLLCSQDGKRISEETYLFVKPKHFHFLHPEFRVEVQNDKEKYILNIQTSCFAKCIKMDLDNNDCEFSDNCFDLSPDRIKTVEISKNSFRRPMEELKKQLIFETVNDIGRIL